MSDTKHNLMIYGGGFGNMQNLYETVKKVQIVYK
jgi:hypothetical protein